MHAKVGVMDGVLSFVGSYNLDPLSAGVNGEVLTTVWSEAFAIDQREHIMKRVRFGKVVEYKLDRDGTTVKVGPESHCDPAALEKVRKMEPMLELLAPLI